MAAAGDANAAGLGMAEAPDQPELVPVVARELRLVPIVLREASLDSPTFRAVAVHFFEQVDAVEKWLTGLNAALAKVAQEATHFEALVAAVTASVVPPTATSEVILDHDYTVLAAQRYGDVWKTFWGQAFVGLKKLEANMIDPIRQFTQTELRSFKDLRRQLDSARNAFDQASARYAGMLKNREPSSIREEAFQLHEARKVYLKASLDVAVAAPQLRVSLDKMLVKAFHEEGQAIWRSQNAQMGKWIDDLERIRGWIREMAEGERAFVREVQTARKQLEEATEASARPSRELDDYALSTAPVSLLTKGPSSAVPSAKPKSYEKQGWLYIRTLTGKPSRTAWLRRWFYVKNGLFGCLVQGSRSGGVEESERIGVLLCGIRAAATEERRFCFEVKTKDITIVLQAESQAEMVEWMGTFDLAKQKALEDPASTDAFAENPANVLDPAFAITPPTAPEFAATPAEAGMHATVEEGHDRNTSLTLPASETVSSFHRSSFDVSNRKSAALDRDLESSRERLMQKLDLRKTSSNLGGSGGQGIASLISATHASMPVGPGAMSTQQSENTAAKSTVQKPTFNPHKMAFLARTMPASSLAPATLANPPAATNLSSTAVAVNGERGIGVGSADKTGGMPGGILANLWGSTNWGYINRFERGEVKPHPPPTEKSPFAESPSSIGAPKRGSTMDLETLPGPFDGSTEAGPIATSPLHRKSQSIDGDGSELSKAVNASMTAKESEFPNYYPVQLKHQDAQFRLLFPNVKRSEKLVLVFRANWVPNEQQEFPGRVYVTQEHIFFYSNHLGLVLVTGFALSRVTEVTAAPGRDCDFLFLHLKGSNDELDFARLTIKTFLHDLKLLQRRLNFMVQNCNSEKPQGLESIMKAMIKLESEVDAPKSPSEESFDELEPSESIRRKRTQPSSKDLRTKILVDQTLSSSIPSLTASDANLKFKLPNKPVVYVPRGMPAAIVERVFDISPKALFHVLFGDRSVVWQLLYHERRARHIRQGPWVREEQSPLRRAFEYDIALPGWFGIAREARVTDTQIIDVHNDHLCYVISDRKTPWHLPYHKEYELLTKVVITHERKSRSKLALYTRIDWRREPFLFGAILERHALADLHLDVLDLMDVVSEQVRKLGSLTTTKKAIQIYGGIGQQNQVIEFKDITDPTNKQPRRNMNPRTMFNLLISAITNLNANLIASIVALGLGAVRWVWRTIGLHRVLLAILLVSMCTNFLLSSRETSVWWRERHARNYMRQLGIGSDMIMNKAIQLDDINLATSVEFPNLDSLDANHCVQSFMAASSSDHAAVPVAEPAILHLQRTRQRLGSYRHDLLVAMRVVNRVENELLLAGWEDWILGETQRCESMSKLLKAHQKAGNVTEAEEIKGRLDGYCSSCREAQTIMNI